MTPLVSTASLSEELTALVHGEDELRQAEANEKRYRDLVETGDAAMITYEQYRTARDTARARVNAAREQLEAQVNVARQSNQAIASAEASGFSQ